MAEYIARKKALKKLCEGCCEYDSENTECSCNEQLAILGIPAANVAPVVHGKWQKDEEYYCCSKCGQAVDYSCTNWFKYCPNCGAHMKEDDNE